MPINLLLRDHKHIEAWSESLPPVRQQEVAEDRTVGKCKCHAVSWRFLELYYGCLMVFVGDKLVKCNVCG